MVLLPRTKHWIVSLPGPVRPHALASEFARIANLLCMVWDDPPACRTHFEDLLVDRRGGRRDFPVTVLRELNVLQAHYVALYDAFDRSHKGS